MQDYWQTIYSGYSRHFVILKLFCHSLPFFCLRKPDNWCLLCYVVSNTVDSIAVTRKKLLAILELN